MDPMTPPPSQPPAKALPPCPSTAPNRAKAAISTEAATTPQSPPTPPASPPLRLPPPSPSTTAFFSRNALPLAATRALCWSFVAAHFPRAPSIHECPAQGYCSYTLLVPETQVIQFRPRPHRLNTSVALLAREVYGVLAPETRFLGVLPVPTTGDGGGAGDEGAGGGQPRAGQQALLLVYTMSIMPGVSLTSLRLGPASEVRLRRAILVRDFARFLATGWKARRARTDIPFLGRLGGSLRARMEMMREKLPSRFRVVVEDVAAGMTGIEALPWILTHGDVVADNIMVEPLGGHRGTGWQPGTLRGMLDWAESEYLPFGVGLYGVEELLGQDVRIYEGHGKARDKFAYYPEVGDLRRMFWQELEGAVPAFGTDRELRAAVERARLLGILLWRGFAFDDGKIDRVVQENRDEGEVQRLDMFLFGTDDPEMHEMVSSEIESRAKRAKESGATVTVSEKNEAPKRWNLTRRISSMLM